jgi:hypothetical protein
MQPAPLLQRALQTHPQSPSEARGVPRGPSPPDPQPRGGGSPENAKDSGLRTPPAPGLGVRRTPVTPSLGRCAFRLQRAFTEKTHRGPNRAVHKPDYISLFFAGQDGGSKGGTQTIFKGTAAAADAVREEARILDRAARQTRAVLRSSTDSYYLHLCADIVQEVYMMGY